MFQYLEQVEAFLHERRTLGIKPGLERMYALLDAQHNPQKKLKAVHIAGTNGKGSTLTYIKAALMENNYRVGVFSSPSLTGLTGHMIIDNLPIEEERFLVLFNQLLPSIRELDLNGMHATEFEIITAIAFMHFSEHVDIAVIEAGMGGKEDSTNCIQPVVSIITNIAKDHASFLGNSLEEIAHHKAGIIKENIPVVVGRVDPTCLSIINMEAKSKTSARYLLDSDFFYMINSISENSQLFDWSYKDLTYSIEIGMRGNHQVENAATALMALQVIERSGFELDWNKVSTAFRYASFPGRFEKVSENPEIIIDGAHNPNGMEAFIHTVNQIYSNKQKHLIFAGFKDKELEDMIRLALPHFDSIALSTFDHTRAADAEKLANVVQTDSIRIVDWMDELNEIKNGKDSYFFAGSLHFIGMVRGYLNKKSL
ncbi:bifunctional folylpolyglutamate synthase/dihydrofolate synthase [Ornithinibacillus californiensis]|uniref:bifunctional folylpolyglutamate synthase/dihydrofolate synthase n=1 Tax=Ornithinibacillus californiensis TaxID=161536 RepID=UPI00064DB778|nr:folylpolyglutamate synthase/dihydrofolate synthase family protein [Ornithinibacillus californiensis]